MEFDGMIAHWRAPDGVHFERKWYQGMHDRSDDSICPHCHGSGVIALRPDQAAVVMAIAAATDCRRSFSCRELLKHADVVGGQLQSWPGGVSETL